MEEKSDTRIVWTVKVCETAGRARFVQLDADSEWITVEQLNTLSAWLRALHETLQG